jgi:succinate dehydrogenase/fumarate reductase cytochrome b subunit
MRRLHRLNAFILGVFLVVHFANHALLFGGIGAHLKAMMVLRGGYRLPGIEHILLGLFATQIILGVVLVFQRGKPSGGWAWAQVLSGGYIAFFLLQHLSAILMARSGLDTNSYFAAAVVSRTPLSYYFAPYYVLGIGAVFTHVACALRFRVWPQPATRLQRALPVVGVVLGVGAVAGLTGATDPFDLPPAYDAYAASLLGD